MDLFTKIKQFKWKNWGIKCLCITFLIFLLVAFCRNIKLANRYLPRLFSKELTFSEFTEKVAGRYQKDLDNKDSYINLNGFFANKLGQNYSNERLKLKNGMLAHPDEEPVDMLERGKNIIQLNYWLRSSDIPFLYVNMPYKYPLNGELNVTGIDNWGNRNADALMELLQNNEVDCVDLRQELSANAQQVEENFYVTDHHWNARGALRGAKIIADHLNETYPRQRYRTDSLNPEDWDILSKKDWFLGSDGRRVGSTFAGVDDLQWALPAYETDMSCSVPLHGIFYRGDFETAVIRKSYLEEINYFHSNPYCIFIGSDYDLVQHRNYNADIKKKILIIKDSFMLPLQAFLSTAFQEIDVVDLRYLENTTLTEYIRETEPDLVMMAHTINVKDGDLGSMDLPAKTTVQKKNTVPGGSQKNVFDIPLIQDATFVIPAADHEWSNKKLVKKALPGVTYNIYFEDAKFTVGKADAFSLILWEENSNEVLQRYDCNIQEYKDKGGFDFQIKVPTDQAEDAVMHVLLYAGLRGEADHKELTVTGLNISEHYEQKSLHDISDSSEVELKYVVENGSLEIPAAESKYNHITALHELEHGAKYTVRFSNARFTDKPGDSFSLLLYDDAAESKLKASICDLKYLKQTGEFVWTFFTPEETEGSLSLLVYSGVNGAADNKSLIVNGLDIAYEK